MLLSDHNGNSIAAVGGILIGRALGSVGLGKSGYSFSISERVRLGQAAPFHLL